MAKQSLDRSELLALLAAAKAKRERDWLMMLIAFSHGLRASEVVGLTPDNFHHGEITVERLKGSEQTTQPLISDENPLLNERAAVFAFLRNFHGKQRLFPITRERFWQLMQEHGASADLPKHKRKPHILKHTIAMQVIRTAGVENVRAYLGHKSMSSTGEYLKVSDSEASAAVSRALKG